MSGRASAIREALRRELAAPLPGRDAQRIAWPDRLLGRAGDATSVSYVHAAVLVALHPAAEDRFSFPMIRRPAASLRHAGQISLPGGESDAGESPVACALREAEEEIGLPRSWVEVLGRLSPVPIPVSGYLVTPVVGWLESAPSWIPQEGEVDGIVAADPDRLLAEGPRGEVRSDRGGSGFTAPAYIVPDAAGPALVWGATAIILAEFLEIWRRVRLYPSGGPYPPCPQP